jgi:hypothetical protein
MTLTAHCDVLDEILSMGDVPSGGGFSLRCLSGCGNIEKREDHHKSRDRDDDW